MYAASGTASGAIFFAAIDRTLQIQFCVMAMHTRQIAFMLIVSFVTTGKSWTDERAEYHVPHIKMRVKSEREREDHLESNSGCDTHWARVSWEVGAEGSTSSQLYHQVQQQKKHHNAKQCKCNAEEPNSIREYYTRGEQALGESWRA